MKKSVKEFLWGKIVPKTIILALFPIIIGILGNYVVTYETTGYYIGIAVTTLTYILYLGGNCIYETKQKKHEQWHDAITTLCREDCFLIRKFADSIYQKINSAVGHVEITDWSAIKNNCDTICKIVYEFIQSTSAHGDQFSVSIFFKRTKNGKNEYNMLSRSSYDSHNPSSYNVFKTDEDTKMYYYRKLFDEAITWPAILSTKEEIRAAFYNCDGVDYSQYIGIPVACLGNKMIALLQIVAYNDSIIAPSKKEIESLVNNYLCTYANLILLADKTENAIHYLSAGECNGLHFKNERKENNVQHD